jgi:hypothetical protein
VELLSVELCINTRGSHESKKLIGKLISGSGRDFSLRHDVQTDSVVHPASYPMSTMDSFLRVKQPKREAVCSNFEQRTGSSAVSYVLLQDA